MKKILLIFLSLFLLIVSSGCKFNVSKDEEVSLITWNEIEKAYKGSFLVPKGDVGNKDQNFHYSQGAFCIQDKDTIFLEGHSYSQEIRKLKLPNTLNGTEAVPEGEWFDPTNKLLSTGETKIDYYQLGDMIMIADKIYFTKHQWYASGVDHDSFGYRQKDDTFANGTTYGLWNADHELAHNIRIGGYLSKAPKSLKNDGVTFLAGQQGLSSDARGRWGPNLFAVKFDATKAQGEAMKVVPLIVHPSKDKQADDWWVADRVYSMTWIETNNKKGVLVLLVKGYGDKWYGEANGHNPPDPYGEYKGYHSTGKQLVAWIYNPDDLLKVYNKELEPHQVKPVEKKVLIDLKPGKTKGQEEYFTKIFKTIGAIRMEMYQNRLIMIQPKGEILPKGFVFDFN